MKKLSKVVKKLRGDLSTAAFGEKIGVSHTAVVEWESGKNVGPFNRMKLLAYAKEIGAEKDVLVALEAAQPEMRP